jgi:hypothetical protein
VQPSIKKFIHSSGIFDNCVDLAISGESFSLFNNKDMQNILKCAQLNQNDNSTINKETVREGVVTKAANLRKKLAAILKNKRLSITADFATCNGVEFLG